MCEMKNIEVSRQWLGDDAIILNIPFSSKVVMSTDLSKARFQELFIEDDMRCRVNASTPTANFSDPEPHLLTCHEALLLQSHRPSHSSDSSVD
jgi:hypothetical protein